MRRDDLCNLCTDFMRHVNDVFAGSIKVKCGQTGKVFVTKIHNLSREDQAESLTIEDLKVGAGLLCDVKGKMYPVEVLEFEDYVRKKTLVKRHAVPVTRKIGT
ncbi:hypothetical protein EMCRGX_G017213 [Ephydatia muelleri]